MPMVIIFRSTIKMVRVPVVNSMNSIMIRGVNSNNNNNIIHIDKKFCSSFSYVRVRVRVCVCVSLVLAISFFFRVFFLSSCNNTRACVRFLHFLQCMRVVSLTKTKRILCLVFDIFPFFKRSVVCVCVWCLLHRQCDFSFFFGMFI